MKTYIFLTYTLGGYSGCPSYIRNKKNWLEKQGWNVIAFDSTGHANIPIEYTDFFKYKKNRIKELFYHPSWYNKNVRQKIINKIKSNINAKSNEIVVESNTIILAEWGELLSAKLKAKHLVYLIEENVKINNLNEFHFLFYKYKKNELFSISSKAFQSLWSDYIIVDDANSHYWNAMSITQPEDITFAGLNNLEKADFTITHFGRFKNYVPNVINEISIFAKNNKEKRINFILFGIESLQLDLKQLIEQNKNIKLYLFNSVFPIPKQIFQISNVIIATAGCASIAARQGIKTISYNVETKLPLGVMCYTTLQSSFSDSLSPDTTQVLNEILEDILIKKKYDYLEPLSLPNPEKGYDYHMMFLNKNNDYYSSILKIDYYLTRNGLIQKILCKLGLIYIASLIRYNKYR